MDSRQVPSATASALMTLGWLSLASKSSSALRTMPATKFDSTCSQSLVTKSSNLRRRRQSLPLSSNGLPRSRLMSSKLVWLRAQPLTWENMRSVARRSLSLLPNQMKLWRPVLHKSFKLSVQETRKLMLSDKDKPIGRVKTSEDATTTSQ